MASYTQFSGTLATGNNVDTAVVDLPGADYIGVYVKSDKALTGKLYITPGSPRDEGFAAGSADWYKIGSDIAIAAGNNFTLVQIAGVGGAAKLNLANAAGSTATITAILRPGPRRPAH